MADRADDSDNALHPLDPQHANEAADEAVARALESNNPSVKKRYEKIDEQIAKERMKKYARSNCLDDAKVMSECVSGRTVTIAFACRDAINALNECLKKYTTPETLERFKAELEKDREAQRERFRAKAALEAREKTNQPR